MYRTVQSVQLQTMQFDRDQRIAVNRLKSGSILVGGTGSGKSRTALVYFFVKVCGGKIEIQDVEGSYFSPMTKHKDLYIITTAAKRDKKEWDQELLPFGIDPGSVVVDSWNNIKKYIDVENAFFIFDEQRVVGSGTWSKSFLKIVKKNEWILLSATPGDTYSDYIPVFIANGFFKNRTEFYKKHVVFSRFTDYPKIERYLNTNQLDKLKSYILIDMDVNKKTIPHRVEVLLDYDKNIYKQITQDRWNPFEDKPIENASQFTQAQRRVVNSDPSRIDKLRDLIFFHRKVIVFYNFNYERDIILDVVNALHISYGEWNGFNHTPIPDEDSWVYLVQYNAGSEGWNCVETNVIIFFSLSYSYRMTHQAAGRIDRRNTEFKDLYYYYFYTDSSIDKNILKSLKEKKDFNEKKYYEKMASQNLQLL